MRPRPPSRWAVLVGLVILWHLAPLARADTVTEPGHRYQLALEGGWSARPVPEDSLAPLAGYEHAESGALLAISRIEYPNLRAWRRRTRGDYFEQVEQGVAVSVQGYRRLRRQATRIGRVPALDLVFRRRGERGREVVFMRFLFFRRYCLTLTVSAPARALRRHRRELRQVHSSFKPLVDAGE